MQARKTLDDADPQVIAIQEALSRIAGVLKADFIPYMPTIMQSLLKSAAASVDMKVATAKEAELENRDEEKDSKAQ